MRIIAGEHRGRRLYAPRGLATRPTTSRVKEAVFNILGAPTRRPGASRFRVLDLYAGSGALALEAISRGADEAVLVDEDREAMRCAERNLGALGLLTPPARARLLQREVGAAIALLDREHDPEHDKGGFDWVFLDPPYDREHGGGVLDRALRLLGRTRLVAGQLVAEHHAQNAPADRYDRLALVERRRWGDTAVSFYRAEIPA